MKNVLKSKTIQGIITAVIGSTGSATAIAGPEYGPTIDLILQIIGTLLALYGRLSKGDLTVLPAGKPPVPPAALFLAIVSMLGLGACAAPNADQGQGQGSSSTPTFVFAPVLNFGAVSGGSKGADSTSTTAPTSAPAATSANEATQRADAKADAKLDATIPTGVPTLTPPGTIP